jgi:hypothetical protein
MAKKVWLCAIYNVESAQSNFLFHRYEDWTGSPEREAIVEVFNETLSAIRGGVVVPIENLPTRLTLAKRVKTPPKKLPPACVNSLVLLRKDVAEIFRRHNLGGMRLHALDLYDKDDTTKLPEQLFALVPGGSQQTIDLAKNNSGLRYVNFSDPPRYFLSAPNDELADLRAIDMPDDDVACWVDKDVPYAIFLNDAVASDLVNAGFKQDLFLIPIF